MINLRKSIIFLICICINLLVYARQPYSVQQQLDNAINNKEKYIVEKLKNIEKLKELLEGENLTLRQKYDINHNLYNEYFKFSTDSAIEYARKNREIAIKLNNKELTNETAINLSSLYSTTGIFNEAIGLLNAIEKSTLSKNQEVSYYKAYNEFYSRYAQSTSHTEYYIESGKYRDSMLMSMDITSFDYRLEFTAGQFFSGQGTDIEETLLILLDDAGDTPDKAFVAWMLGNYHQQRGNFEKCKMYYSISAISDIEHCIRDNASMQSLALLYFEQGEITRANQFILYAMEDALFCNVRYRITDASSYYPIITTIYQNQEKKQISKLYSSLVIISLLVIILLISVALFLRQNNKLSKISRELSTANLELNELHTVKDKLFSVIAHDLRNPIVTLMETMKLATGNKLDTQTQELILTDISNRVEDAHSLLDNLLRWAKSQMKGIIPAPIYFDAYIESSKVTDNFKESASAKKINLCNKIENHQVYADKDLFMVVIRNLVANAIKYSSPEEEVTLNSELAGDMVIISVKDTGTGMTEKVQDNLFKLAGTKSVKGTKNESGTGLGLTLCADFVNKNGGKIWFTSKEGVGSTFFFNLPIKENQINIL